MKNTEQRCGLVALIGRPNVGKSTLLNALLGEKISITSRKPQTTRQQILGIKTTDKVQTVYIDTPGLHKPHRQAIHRYMNRAALEALKEVDVVVWLVDSLCWKEEDESIVQKLGFLKQPIICVINKVDKIANKDQLLPYIQQITEKGLSLAAIIPLSAKRRINLAALETEIAKHLPVSEFMFPSEQITTQDHRFLAAELIREKVMRLLGQEVPYATAVSIERWEETENLVSIHAIIWVERLGQKKIIVPRLKEIGTKARLSIERLLERKVYLGLWVKVKKEWTQDEAALKMLGYQ